MRQNLFYQRPSTKITKTYTWNLHTPYLTYSINRRTDNTETIIQRSIRFHYYVWSSLAYSYLYGIPLLILSMESASNIMSWYCAFVKLTDSCSMCKLSITLGMLNFGVSPSGLGFNFNFAVAFIGPNAVTQNVF